MKQSVNPKYDARGALAAAADFADNDLQPVKVVARGGGGLAQGQTRVQGLRRGTTCSAAGISLPGLPIPGLTIPGAMKAAKHAAKPKPKACAGLEIDSEV